MFRIFRLLLLWAVPSLCFFKLAGLAGSRPLESPTPKPTFAVGASNTSTFPRAKGRDLTKKVYGERPPHERQEVNATASPVLIPDQPEFWFDELGFYLAGYAYRGQEEEYFPIGAELDFEQNTGIVCRRDRSQNGRQTFLLHCPWRSGTGIVFQQFAIQLPLVKTITLKGATALRSDAVAKSDGVTFRLYVDQEKKLEVSRSDAVWQPYSFDLTDSAGRTVLIRFENDPGPADNAAFDFSLWGDRELVLEEYKPTVQSHPEPPPLDLERVSTDSGSVIPASGFGGSSSVVMEQDTVVVKYSGSDGTLEFCWHPPSSSVDPPLGNFLLQAQQVGGTAFSLPLAGDARIEWSQAAAWEESHWEQSSMSPVLAVNYRIGGELVTLRARPSMVNKSLVLDISCDRPVVSGFTAGTFGPVFRRRPVVVPYYSGNLYFLSHENLFANTFLDWTASDASSYSGGLARYDTRTDGGRVPLKERVIFTAAWHLGEALPNIPNTPSPYRDELSGRLVLDIWGGGSFSEIAARLKELASYGLDRCAVIVHDWQRSGYDNALPMHIPARAALGGEAGMQELIRAARDIGYPIALHENYVDYYPNYDYFNSDDISLDSAGRRVQAWFNPVTGIQSYGEKPEAMVRLASTQSPEIHRRYGTDAAFLDVNSAVEPWKNIDYRTSTRQSAQFRQYSDRATDLWQYLRDTYRGPVFGEGLFHWYWSGLLDGVEAQLGVGWPLNQGSTAPLLVDFDLLKIHPLQVNHGMGYYSRWLDPSAGAAPPPMVRMDQYRMQEIAFGHAPFLDSMAFWSSVPLAWLEHHLVTPVAREYGTSLPVRISYQIDGEWHDSTVAAKQESSNRVRVEYENGLTVTVNGGPTPMEVGTLQLPVFGWLAQNQDLSAFTALRGNSIIDFVDTGSLVFANARNAIDWDFLPKTAVPSVIGFDQKGYREFQLTYQWKVVGRIPGDYLSFVHFVAGEAGGTEQITFQQDHSLPQTTSAWNAGDTVRDGPYTLILPADVADGDYRCLAGLYLSSGPRLSLVGGDGENRVLLGVLHIRSNGQKITFEIGSEAQQAIQLYRDHVNDPVQVIDFGPVRTDGSILIRSLGGNWILQTMPRDRSFTILLDIRRFGRPQTVYCQGGWQPSVAPVSLEQGWWRLPMTGADSYRWQSNLWEKVFERRRTRQSRRYR